VDTVCDGSIGCNRYEGRLRTKPPHGKGNPPAARGTLALRYTDALIWTPAHIAPDVAAAVLDHFSPAQARELTLDVMRNASNKIAVALKADAPRVQQGTERYLIDADGQPVYG
jgi:alkylhydroperoxidase family enzyme